MFLIICWWDKVKAQHTVDCDEEDDDMADDAGCLLWRGWWFWGLWLKSWRSVECVATYQSVVKKQILSVWPGDETGSFPSGVVRRGLTSHLSFYPKQSLVEHQRRDSELVSFYLFTQGRSTEQCLLVPSPPQLLPLLLGGVVTNKAASPRQPLHHHWTWTRAEPQAALSAGRKWSHASDTFSATRKRP